MISEINTEVAGDDGREVRQRPIEQHQIVGRRALLRPVHVRGSARSRERVVDVAGDRERHVAHGGRKPAEIDSRELQQPRAAGRDRLPLRVEQERAEGLRGPRAAVRRRAPPDAYDHANRPALERGPDQLPRSSGGCP